MIIIIIIISSSSSISIISIRMIIMPIGLIFKKPYVSISMQLFIELFRGFSAPHWCWSYLFKMLHLRINAGIWYAKIFVREL